MVSVGTCWGVACTRVRTRVMLGSATHAPGPVCSHANVSRPSSQGLAPLLSLSVGPLVGLSCHVDTTHVTSSVTLAPVHHALSPWTGSAPAASPPPGCPAQRRPPPAGTRVGRCWGVGVTTALRDVTVETVPPAYRWRASSAGAGPR